MNRWDIINAFIEKHNYKSYLEIGYYKGWSFDQVNNVWKVAVDPNPSKTPEMQKLDMHGVMQLENEALLFKMPSDTYFKLQNRVGVITHLFDIIFIDGLHEAEQVAKDIENSLKFLSPGGTIILHDCNPPKYEHTTTGIDGCWTGDVYKTVIKVVANPRYHFYTIDTDWGVGVLQRAGMVLSHDPNVQKYIDNWDLFDQNRAELLNLISVEEFKTKMNEGITDTDLSTK